MATLDKVSVDLMVVLGTTTMPIHQVMRLSRGAIIELDATEQDEVKILATMDPQQSRIVELRFFAGLTVEDTSEALGISPATVKRSWTSARAWLHREMTRESAP